jgi:hypothetical protein
MQVVHISTYELMDPSVAWTLGVEPPAPRPRDGPVRWPVYFLKSN